MVDGLRFRVFVDILLAAVEAYFPFMDSARQLPFTDLDQKSQSRRV